MLYQAIPNWNELRRRYTSFWQFEIPTDGGFIAHIQNPNPERQDPEPWMLQAREDKYLDPAKLLQLKNWRSTAWNWHADLFQYTLPSYGPNTFIGFCGAKPMFGAETVWHESSADSIEKAEDLYFDQDNFYWRQHLATVEYFVEACRGVMPLGMSDFGGPADWLVTAMGAEAFMIASLEHPARMRALALRLAAQCNEAFDVVHERIAAANDGQVNWMPVWSPLSYQTVQDDIAVALSPELYAEVFLPALKQLAQHTAHSVIHWHDGAWQQLENVLQLQSASVLQYGHDPNSRPFRESIEPMQQIQAARKHLFISCVEAADVEYFVQHLDPRGLMMIINCATDRQSTQMSEQIRLWTNKRMSTKEE